MSNDPVWPEYDERTQAMVDAMVESEERTLAARKAELEDCDCKDGMFPTAGRPASRRSFLAATAAMAGGTTLGLAARGAAADAPPGAIEFPVPDDPTKIQGRLTSDDGGYGSRSQFESEVRWRFPTATKESSWTMTPLESLDTGSSPRPGSTSSATTAASPTSIRNATPSSSTGWWIGP